MIEFQNVSKSFWTGKKRKIILDRASFRVEVGQSLGILAPNGTGKSTVINMMAGTEKPDDGRIYKTSRVGFAMGFSGGVNAKLSALENSRYIARIYGLDPDYVESFCRWLSDLKEYFEMPLGTYSSGMRARFNLSLMLSLDFDIYLVDEGMPATLDAEFNRRAGAVMREKLKNATVVIVSHQPSTVAKFAERAGVLLNGQLYMFDTLEEARRLYNYA